MYVAVHVKNITDQILKLLVLIKTFIYVKEYLCGGAKMHLSIGINTYNSANACVV